MYGKKQWIKNESIPKLKRFDKQTPSYSNERTHTSFYDTLTNKLYGNSKFHVDPWFAALENIKTVERMELTSWESKTVSTANNINYNTKSAIDKLARAIQSIKCL